MAPVPVTQSPILGRWPPQELTAQKSGDDTPGGTEALPADHADSHPAVASRIENLETKAGWSSPQPDEDWMTGDPQEIHDFVEGISHGREPLSGAALARDVIAAICGAYLSAAEGRRVDLTPFLAP